jgi:hypothetical protein
MNSEDHGSVFQISLPDPPAKEGKVLADEDNRENFPIFMTDEITDMPKEEPKIAQREFLPTSSSFSPRLDSWQAAEPPKEPKQTDDRPTNGFGVTLAEKVGDKTDRSGEVVELPQEGVKVGPRESSQGLQQSKVPVSPRASVQKVEESVKEDGKTTTNNMTQKSETPANVIAKIVDEKPRYDAKPMPTPSVFTIDDLFKEISQPAKEVKPSTVEIKEKETPNVSQTTTEAEDVWTPPKNFKIKKSKKTFSTRY